MTVKGRKSIKGKIEIKSDVKKKEIICERMKEGKKDMERENGGDGN